MKQSFWQRATSSKVLMLSIAIHLVFGAAATYFVVQSIQMKRKMTFEGGPPVVNASKRALEHKVSLGKKKAVMSAPAQAKQPAEQTNAHADAAPPPVDNSLRSVLQKMFRPD